MFASASSPPRLSTLIVLSIVGILALNLILPSLAHIAEDFGVSYAQASLSISLFMIVTACLQLVIGPISDLFGRRPVLLVSICVFTFASVGAGLAQSFTVFMAFRILQSVVVAANTLPRAIVRDTTEPREATAILGTMGMVMAMGPMFAPLAGGALDQLFGWRANFAAFTLCGAFILWLVWIDAGETNTTSGRGFAAQFRAYPRLLTDPAFWSFTLCMGFSVGAYFTFLTGTPLIAGPEFGLGGAALGLALGAPPVGFVLGNWLTRRHGQSVAPQRLMMAGRVVSVCGMAIPLALWLGGSTSLWHFVPFMTLIGLGNGLTLPAGTVGAMSVAPDLAGSASGLTGAVTIGMGALATAVTGAVLTRFPEALALILLLNATALLSLVAGLPAFRAKSSAAAA